MKKGEGKTRLTRREKRRIVLYVIVTVCLVIAGSVAVSRYQEQAFQKKADPVDEKDVRKTDASVLTYKGQTYVPKQHVRSYLFLGIDSPGTIYEQKELNQGGQADVQMLLVIDEQNRTWQILNIDRDSMVDVPVLSLFGRVTGYETKQIALAHAYGSGLESSCENAELAVSRLLNDQRIDGYLSLNMDAIKVVNNELGGLEVTVTDDFSEVDPSLKKGETVVLSDEQAEEFVRTRRHVADETNESRMKRHESVLRAVKDKLDLLSDEELVSLYNALQDYMVSDLGSQEAVDLVHDCQTMKELPVRMFKGKQIVVKDNFGWELDRDNVEETVIELFYEPKRGRSG